MKKILIIDTSDVAARYTADAIISMGYFPVFLINIRNFQGDTIKQVERYTYFDVNTNSCEELEKTIRKFNICDIEGVFTALDSKIPIAIELAEKLNARGLPTELLKLSTKNNVITLIPEYSPKSILIQRNNLINQIESITKMAQTHNQLLLKPNNAAGGIGVKVLSDHFNPNEVKTHINQFDFENWVLMEFIDGDLVSLEGFFYHGRCTFLGYTSRKKIGNTESYFEFPVNNTLPKNIKLTTQNAIETLAKRSGYINGYFHTEFMINEQQCFLIDANFGRIGGGPLIDLIAESHGISSVEIMKHIISISLFNNVSLHHFPFHLKHIKHSCGVAYGILKNATLIDIKMPTTPKSITHTQLLDFGTSIPPMGSNNWAWIGLISGERNSVIQLLQQMTIETDQGMVPPCY